MVNKILVTRSQVNWTQLIYLLTKRQIKPEVRVQVYFYDALAQGLKSLEEFKDEDPMQLNNALLGLYARNLYHEVHSSSYIVLTSCFHFKYFPVSFLAGSAKATRS